MAWSERVDLAAVHELGQVHVSVGTRPSTVSNAVTHWPSRTDGTTCRYSRRRRLGGDDDRLAAPHVDDPGADRVHSGTVGAEM